MALTSVSAYRLAGYQFTNDDFDNNAEIASSKLGTRTLYKTIPAAACTLNGSGCTRTNSGVFGGVTMPDANDSDISYSLRLPVEWDSGNITLRILWNTAATSGDIRLVTTYSAIKSGEATNATTQTVTSTDTADGTASDLNEITFTLTGTNFEAGDYIGIKITREPANASDTLGANAIIFALSFEYTGRG